LITDFTHRLDYDDLGGNAHIVVRDLETREREVRGKDGSWYLARLKPYRIVEGKLDGVVVTFVDIGERRRMEDALRESESRMILVGELQHRTRNLIGVVMALADRTAGGSPSLDAFRTSLAERLMALVPLQGLLSRAPSGDSVTFDELLASELSAQSVENDAGITLEGPRGVVLRFISVQALAMALHELATNAVKYGALGQSSGRLHVGWRVQAEDGAPCILVDWKESGVETSPPGDKPRGAGSGRRLIEDALPYQFGARTTFAIEPDGVHCTIALPLSGPQTEEMQDGQLGAS
jgi:two-component sensor histidine kinase